MSAKLQIAIGVLLFIAGLAVAVAGSVPVGAAALAVVTVFVVPVAVVLASFGGALIGGGICRLS
jgi:hypothetical protein